MTKEEFYWSKHIVAIEWWLHECDLLDKLTWARLRVFDDGTADSCFDDGGKLYGFENRNSAGYILSEDEYISFEGMDEEDEQEYGIKLAEIYTPVWLDNPDQLFEYLGSY
ncbi:hypothetical protein [Nostoc sp. WHI]|uniref:hypothetical protein n=1 Tax=Nostoc sp. WHI TaxID=2650611 RepID=UPI0018C85D9E|nr:hypothetical protein [Nostoc sp. WHI]MBG1270515.1 hypothetical protein [Nostoc sp. WHI]